MNSTFSQNNNTSSSVVGHESFYAYCVNTGKQFLADQWDYSKNLDINPETVAAKSHKRVWWKCEKGHSWQAMIFSRTDNNSGCPYCANKKPDDTAPTLQSMYPSVAAQWHPEKNGILKPSDITPSTHKKVWWKCIKGHEWQAQVNSRVHGAGCPVCSNRKVVVGENDLATINPILAEQWHDEKNYPLTPYEVTEGSHKKVWWKCEKGHEWQAAIFSRSGGAGCPVCAGKIILAGENDLESSFPQIASQWHYEKNGKLKPSEIPPFSNKTVWWKCEYGHEYQASVAHRTQERSDCPYCTGRKVLAGFNDLGTKEPLIAEQWDSELNGSLTPQMVTVSSHKKVWWKCSAGHVWKARIASRTCDRRHGCPVCAGKVNAGKKYDAIFADSANPVHEIEVQL